MARPETFDKAMQLRLNQALIDEIDRWMKSRGHDWSRSEAIRTLVKMGMKVDPGRKKHANELMQSIEKNAAQSIQDYENIDEFDGAGLRELIHKTTTSLTGLTELDQEMEHFIDDRMTLRRALSQVRKVQIDIIHEASNALSKLNDEI